MTHDETYQTDKFGNLLMLVTGGTNHTMAEEHLLYRKALRAVVELHKPSGQGLGYAAYCHQCMFNHGSGEIKNHAYPCPTIRAIEKELG